MLPRLLALCGLVALAAATPAAGEMTLERSNAADAAGFIAQRTTDSVVGGASSLSSERLQLHLDQIAVIAADLESRLRAGQDKETTRPAYLELRKARLTVISLAMQKRVVLPAVDTVLFEEMLDELDRYFAEP